MTVIEVDGLYKVFGRKPHTAVRRLQAGEPVENVRKEGLVPAVIDASFTVREGEIFVVMGLSGSGKSTLIRMVNGLQTPTAGTVKVHGIDLSNASTRQLREARRDKISMVFQHFALLPHRTVLENAAYPLQIRGVRSADRHRAAMGALEICGLERCADMLPTELSGGMRQRVGLARALTADTPVLLMDEAFSALDPLIRREMQDMMMDLHKNLGKTVLFITHDLNEAMRVGDRIAMMRNGRIEQIGTPDEIMNSPANEYVAKFMADVDRTRVLTAGSVIAKDLPLIEEKFSRGEALATMVSSAHDQALVTSAGRPLGHVTASGLSKLASTGSIRDALEAHPSPVSERTPVADLFPLLARTQFAVPVVDEHGIVVGQVTRQSLLAGLGPRTRGQLHEQDPASSPASLTERVAAI